MKKTNTKRRSLKEDLVKSMKTYTINFITVPFSYNVHNEIHDIAHYISNKSEIDPDQVDDYSNLKSYLKSVDVVGDVNHYGEPCVRLVFSFNKDVSKNIILKKKLVDMSYQASRTILNSNLRDKLQSLFGIKLLLDKPDLVPQI